MLSKLTAPTRTPATHTPVATPIPGHDRPADVAGGRVAQVDELFERVGRVVQTTIDDRGAVAIWCLVLGLRRYRAGRRRRFGRGAEC